MHTAAKPNSIRFEIQAFNRNDYFLLSSEVDPVMHMFFTVIHIISCIFFFTGFYSIGKFYKNRILAISAILMLILLPLINILDLVKEYYFSIGLSLLFILMAINMIAIGIGLLKEAFDRKGYENSTLYKITGIITILISVLYLSLNTEIINAGLLLSFPGNILMIYILYKELHKPKGFSD